MADTIGRGVIEIVADARKLKAGIDEAKRSIRTLGEGQKDVSKSAQQSIDRYIGKLQQQNAVLGKSVRETELYKLALRGASNEQIRSADAALRYAENHQRNLALTERINRGFIATAAAATALATAYVGLTLRTVDYLDRLEDLSKSTNISVENLAGLGLLAKQTGADLEGIAKAINRMSVEMGKNPEQFRELGVTAKDAIGAFKQLADIFNQLPDINQRNALAQKVFGKSWQELAPALAEGGKRIGEIVEKGARLSGVTKEMTGRAAEFRDRLDELKISMATFGVDFLPTLIRITNELIAAKEGANGLISALSRFFSLSGAQASKPAETLAVVDEKLSKLRKTAEEFASMGLFKRIFSADDIAIVNAQISRLETQRDMLGKLVAASKPKAAEAAETPATIAAKRKEQEAAAARAARFLKEPKTGGGSSPIDAARQEAAARLAFDLAQIKKSSDATIGAFANAERIMGAMRAAGLVADKDFYASKLGFIRLNSQEQEAALQQEISRLQRETFAGKTAAKDRLDNQAKIADAEAKIALLRANATAQITVNSIDEKAAMALVAQAYDDANESAKAYLATIERQNQREIEGIGRGQKFRDQQAGINAIDDKKLEARQRLDSELRKKQITKAQFEDYLKIVNDTYAKEVAAYEKRTATLTQLQSDGYNGALEALRNYQDEASDIAAQTEELFTGAFQGLEDALVEFTKTGKLDFKSLVDSIEENIARMAIKSFITAPLSKMMENAIGGGTGFGSGLFQRQGAAAPISEGVASLGGGGSAAAGAEAAVALKSVAESSKVTTFALKEFADDGVAGATQQMFENVSAGVIEQTAEQAATSSLASLTISANLAAAALASVASQQTANAISGAVQSSAGGYSGGGQIRGAGTGTSDSIPVLLSDKEFVVRADKTSDPGALKFLNTVNQHGVAAAMSAVLRNASRRAEGGQVRTPGINFMSANGGLQMQRGERVTAASAQSSAPPSVVVNQSFAPGTDTRTVNQAATAAGRVMQRAMRRNG